MDDARLGDRLRDLRQSSPADLSTQAAVADSLGVSIASISAWESGRSVPPESRLQDYARHFALVLNGGSGAEGDLDDSQEEARERLINELGRLRDRAAATDHLRQPHPGHAAATQAASTGGTHNGTSEPARRNSGLAARSLGAFWSFDDTLPVHILCSPMPDRQIEDVDYARRDHPNYIHTLHNGDADALIELFGHVRASNPLSDVRFRTLADPITSDHLTGHVVLLGGGDYFSGEGTRATAPETKDVLGWFIRRLELPVTVRWPDPDSEFGAQFVVTVDDDGIAGFGAKHERPYSPRLVEPTGDDAFPLLEYDVALLARRPNPLNTAATMTVCTGVYSRGTLGAVRMLTDKALRDGNAARLARQFGPELDDFWQLVHVPVLNGETITPDLARPFIRLASSPTTSERRQPLTGEGNREVGTGTGETEPDA